MATSAPDRTGAPSILPSEATGPTAPTASDLSPNVRESITVVVSTSAESGRVIGGRYVSDEPEGAFRWSSRFDMGATGYRYFMTEGQAEIGDAGCFEIIQLGDVVHSRKTNDIEPDDGGAAFTPMEGAEAAETTEAFNEETFPTTAEELFATIGVPMPNALVPTVFESDLEPSHVDVLIETMWASWHFDAPASGSVVVTEDESGRLTQVVLDAAGTSRSGRSQSVRIEAIVTTVDEPMTIGSPRPETGFCRNRTLDAIGEWRMTAVASGGSVAPVDELLPGAFIVVGADGTVSGSTGCRSFTGIVEFGYQRLLAPELDFSDSSCVAGGDELGDALMSSLLAGPQVGVQPEGMLWLVTDETEVAFIYEPS